MSTPRRSVWLLLAVCSCPRCLPTTAVREPRCWGLWRILLERVQPEYGRIHAGVACAATVRLCQRRNPTPLHWSDDNPPDSAHTPDECYRYGDDHGRAYGNGCVDDADLLNVLFNFGSDGSNGGDANCDGIVDDADLLDVLFNFGSGC